MAHRRSLDTDRRHQRIRIASSERGSCDSDGAGNVLFLCPQDLRQCHGSGHDSRVGHDNRSVARRRQLPSRHAADLLHRHFGLRSAMDGEAEAVGRRHSADDLRRTHKRACRNGSALPHRRHIFFTASQALLADIRAHDSQRTSRARRSRPMVLGCLQCRRRQIPQARSRRKLRTVHRHNVI